MRARLFVVATVVTVAVLGGVVAAGGASPSACPRAVRGLGMVAVVARGRVEVMDLATCRTRVVARVRVPSPVGRANSPVVHFLGDGRWLVYATTAANGSLRGPFAVPVTGGRARKPLGSGLVAFPLGRRPRAGRRHLLGSLTGPEQNCRGPERSQGDDSACGKRCEHSDATGRLGLWPRYECESGVPATRRRSSPSSRTQRS